MQTTEQPKTPAQNEPSTTVAQRKPDGEARTYTVRGKGKRRELSLQCGALRLRGLSHAQIGHALGVPDSTVGYMLKEYNRLQDEGLRDLTASKIAAGIYRCSKERQTKLWALVTNNHETNPHIVLGALNALRAEDDHIVKHGQSLGLIPKEPEKHEITGGTSWYDLMVRAMSKPTNGHGGNGTNGSNGSTKPRPKADVPGRSAPDTETLTGRLAILE